MSNTDAMARVAVEGTKKATRKPKRGDYRDVMAWKAALDKYNDRYDKAMGWDESKTMEEGDKALRKANKGKDLPEDIKKEQDRRDKLKSIFKKENQKPKKPKKKKKKKAPITSGGLEWNKRRGAARKKAREESKKQLEATIAENKAKKYK